VTHRHRRERYAFGSWSGCSSVAGNQCTVTVTKNTLVTATFSAAASASHGLQPDRVRGRARNVSGGGIDCHSNAGTCGLQGVPTGTTVTLTGTGVNGFAFGSWSGCSSHR
jgi:hypothetical protein